MTDSIQHSNGERFDEFRAGLNEMALHPKAGDVVMGACAATAQVAIDELPSYHQLVVDQLTLRGGLPPFYLAELHGKAAQDLMLGGYPDNGYPHGYDDPIAWRPVFEMVSGPDDFPEQSRRFADIVLTKGNSANRPERYAGAVLAASLFAERLGHAITSLDVGCSEHLGYKRWAQLALPGFAPLERIEVVRRVHDTDVFETDSIEPCINNLIASNMPQLEWGLGIDSMDIRQEANTRYARACSFYGIELRDPAHYEAHQTLEESSPPNVVFLPLDFTNDEIDPVLAANDGQKFDLVTIFSMIYEQGDQRMIKKVVENSLQAVKPDGLVVIQDIVSSSSESESGLLVHPRGYQEPYQYRLLILDPRDPSQKFQELFVWENGRCRRGYLGRDFGSIVLNASVTV